MTVALPRTPSFRLDGKRALITGAGRGLGVGVAAALAKAGAHVTLVSRTQDEIEAVAQAIRADGGQADALTLDVTDVAAMRQAIAARPADHIVVNNAGTNRPKPIADVTEEDYDAVLGLNTRALFFVSQAAATRMIANNEGGSIIHMSSQMGHVGGPRRTLYCASKWAVEGMSKAMALDLAPYNIRVNTIAPTFIETPMTKPFFEDKAFAADVLRRIKLGRLGQVEDIMGAVVYLASDASSLVTGTSIVIDGGWTAD